MPRPHKSLPALRRRYRSAANPDYSEELKALNDPVQVRKGRFGGLTRAMRRNQRVEDWKVQMAVNDGWNVPRDLKESVQKLLKKRATPSERLRREVERVGRPLTIEEVLNFLGSTGSEVNREKTENGA